MKECITVVIYHIGGVQVSTVGFVDLDAVIETPVESGVSTPLGGPSPLADHHHGPAVFGGVGASKVQAGVNLKNP
jgi:hypothetical protein